jgi:hypothetical protein
MHKVCYYILNNAKSSKKGGLKIAVRIFEVNTNYPIISFKDGEGPFHNLKILI